MRHIQLFIDSAAVLKLQGPILLYGTLERRDANRQCLALSERDYGCSKKKTIKTLLMI